MSSSRSRLRQLRQGEYQKLLLAPPPKEPAWCHGIVVWVHDLMTYEPNAHPQYSRVRSEVELCPNTFALLPSFDREVCVFETVRRQIARPFARSGSKEEVVIRARFEVYMAMPIRKVETMRPARAVVDELVAALGAENHEISTPNCLIPSAHEEEMDARKRSIV